MREKLLWTSLVYICVSRCHDMIAEMGQIASQHEPTVRFLRLSHMSLPACLAGTVCVVSGALAVCQEVRIAYLLLISSSAQALCPLAVWSRAGAHTHLISPDRVWEVWGAGLLCIPLRAFHCLQTPAVLTFRSQVEQVDTGSPPQPR